MKIIKKEFIFDDPTPMPECHASTILKLDNGELMSAWFSGTKEGNEDVMIWCSHTQNGEWTKPVCVTKEEGIQHWNPVLFKKQDGEIILFYKLGPVIADWKTYCITFDKNLIPGEAKELIPGDISGGRGPVKNKMFVTSQGKILAPGSTEQGRWKCFVDKWDGEECWTKIDIPFDEDVDIIQPTLWESKPGNIHAMFRSNKGKIYRSDSEDDGETWSKIYPTRMPNNNSGIDCVAIENGTLLLVCNPVEGDWAARSPISLFASYDNGQNFEKLADLETDEGEFSYPAIIADKNKVHITYTWHRKKIMHWEIEF